MHSVSASSSDSMQCLEGHLPSWIIYHPHLSLISGCTLNDILSFVVNSSLLSFLWLCKRGGKWEKKPEMVNGLHLNSYFLDLVINQRASFVQHRSAFTQHTGGRIYHARCCLFIMSNNISPQTYTVGTVIKKCSPEEPGIEPATHCTSWATAAHWCTSPLIKVSF